MAWEFKCGSFISGLQVFAIFYLSYVVVISWRKYWARNYSSKVKILLLFIKYFLLNAFSYVVLLLFHIYLACFFANIKKIRILWAFAIIYIQFVYIQFCTFLVELANWSWAWDLFSQLCSEILANVQANI